MKFTSVMTDQDSAKPYREHRRSIHTNRLLVARRGRGEERLKRYQKSAHSDRRREKKLLGHISLSGLKFRWTTE